MAEQMSTELARQIAAHLRNFLNNASEMSVGRSHGDPYHYLKGCVADFAEGLEAGDTAWVIPAVTPEERHAGVLANSPFTRNANDVLGPTAYDRKRDDIWAHVDELRRAVAATLVRVEGTTSGYRKVGYFALVFGETTKFYRVTQHTAGKWDGRVFVDAQASDDYHPVKNPTSLAQVLGLIADDPEAAAKRYARELGRCSRCARTLTDEESRAAGMGPDCRALAAR